MASSGEVSEVTMKNLYAYSRNSHLVPVESPCVSPCFQSVPAAVSGYYSKFGTAFLNDLHQPCTNLGGAIQVSNNILLPADGYSFEPNSNGDVDGMLGYMLQRTPIGKMHADDDRNYWTIVVDTENFQGPLVYSSAYHWEHPNSWRPVSSETNATKGPHTSVVFLKPFLTLLPTYIIVAGYSHMG